MNVLPNEVLLYILSHLRGQDLIRCLGVCQRWKEILDSESMWKDACKKDYKEVYLEAYKKGHLSWQTLYKSLTLWPEIDYATTKTQKLNSAKVLHFRVLHGIIGVPQFKSYIPNNNIAFSDTIIYYDLETLKECNREVFNFDFILHTYDENENFIVVVHKHRKLCIHLKANRECFFVGDLQNFNIYISEFDSFGLFYNEIWFLEESGMICVSKLEQKDSDFIVKTIPSKKFKDDIVSYAYINCNQINIFTEDCIVYSLIDNELNEISNLANCERDLRDELKYHGFNWGSPAIHKWLQLFEEDDNAISNFKDADYIHIHGESILVGAYDCILNIYHNPYSNGELVIYTIEPNFIYDLRKKFEIKRKDDSFNRKQQLDVVETETGPKILILIADQLFILQLIHNYERLATECPAPKPKIFCN